MARRVMTDLIRNEIWSKLRNGDVDVTRGDDITSSTAQRDDL